MNKVISVASSVALAAMTVFTSMPANAAPNPMQRQQFVMNWCQSHPRDNSCNDFNRNRHRWSDAQYQSWYRSHRGDRGFDPLAAGIFGFAAGAIVAGAAASANTRNNSAHIAACQNAYRSYDVRSDTYLGYDGVRHQCTL